jgi:hypothetical protein
MLKYLAVYTRDVGLNSDYTWFGDELQQDQLTAEMLEKRSIYMSFLVNASFERNINFCMWQTEKEVCLLIYPLFSKRFDFMRRQILSGFYLVYDKHSNLKEQLCNLLGQLNENIGLLLQNTADSWFDNLTKNLLDARSKLDLETLPKSEVSKEIGYVFRDQLPNSLLLHKSLFQKHLDQMIDYFLQESTSEFFKTKAIFNAENMTYEQCHILCNHDQYEVEWLFLTSITQSEEFKKIEDPKHRSKVLMLYLKKGISYLKNQIKS